MCLVAQSCPTLCNLMDCSPPGSSVHGDSPGKSTGVGCHALLLQGIFPTQGSNPGLPHGRQIVLPTEPPGKPKNTGVGSLSLLQGIFPNQESNQGLPHWRWILYQLSLSILRLWYHQFSSVTQSCPTLCDPMNRSTPGLPVHHHHPEFTQTHVHRVRDAIQPSHPQSSPSPPAPNPSKHQSLFQ